MTDFSPLHSALYESTPENIADALRYLRKADAVITALMPTFAAQQPAAAVPAEAQAGRAYNEKQIARELERTALGDGFYGNALRVAKDLPGVTADDRALLDRFATDMSRSTDHVALQDLAIRIYRALSQQPAAAVPDVLCTTCGQPTMHMGPMCYGCCQDAMLAAARGKE